TNYGQAQVNDIELYMLKFEYPIAMKNLVQLISWIPWRDIWNYPQGQQIAASAVQLFSEHILSQNNKKLDYP
ncbi:hypothetical protein, partial [Desulfomarina sp.]